jgi:RNA polymerase sigma-70 factor (ECF subfamily)
MDAPAPGSADATLDQAALVRALRAGELRAFDVAYARHRARVFSFLLRLSGRRDTAEDLLQETFLRLATHAPTLAEDTVLAAWLFTVARNLWRSHRRWRLLDATRLRELAFAPTAPSPSPHGLAEANQTSARLEAALASLPETYREVLLLVAVERLEPQQAAAVLGLRDDALRQRLSRARGMLAEAMDKGARDGAPQRGAVR